MKIWLNGALTDAAAARIDPADRGFTMGDGVFETIRVLAGQPAFLPQHLARLRAGAACLNIALPWNGDHIASGIADVLRENGLRDAAIRVTLTRGPAARGVLPPAAGTPTLLIAATKLPKALPPARVMVCTITRRNEHSPLARIKSLNYLDSILARQEAATAGFDDAIMLNTRGQLAEATAANIFLIKNNVITTPRIADGALPGIMRAALIAQLGAVEATLSIDDLHQAEAAFLSNALGVREIAQIEDRPLQAWPETIKLLF